VIHLFSNQCHDESEVWCGDPDYFQCESDGRGGVVFLSQGTGDVGEVDCKACLVAANDFGANVSRRLREVHGAEGYR
jgi:hypothetical protein